MALNPIHYYGASGGSFAPGQLPLLTAQTNDQRWRIKQQVASPARPLPPVPVFARAPITATACILRTSDQVTYRVLLAATASVGGNSFVTRNSAGTTVTTDPPVRSVILASYAPVEWLEFATVYLGGDTPSTEAAAVAEFLAIVEDTWDWTPY